jgi:hypothetical protein
MFAPARLLEMENPSCLLYGPGVAKIEDRHIPTLEDANDVIVRIRFVGVCGSDVSSSPMPLLFKYSLVLEGRLMLKTGAFLEAWGHSDSCHGASSHGP